MSRAQIISLAEAGVAQSVIASRCGVSASYVSQILHEDSLKTKVLEAQLSLLDERTQRDSKYDAIEDILLEKLRARLPDIYKPQDILRSLLAINKAERRGATSQQLAELANTKESTVVALELPERMRTRILKSHTKEIISVNERALITKDSRVLLEEISSEPVIDALDVDLTQPPDYVNLSTRPIAETDSTSQTTFSENFAEDSIAAASNVIADLDAIPQSSSNDSARAE